MNVARFGRGCLIAALSWTVLAAAAVASDDNSVLVLQQAHAWARFKAGAWRHVRIVTDSFDEQGQVANSSTTDNVATLEEVTPDHVTLKVEVTVEIAGQKFPSQPQILQQGYAGETIGQTVSITPLDGERLTVDGREIACEARANRNPGRKQQGSHPDQLLAADDSGDPQTQKHDQRHHQRPNHAGGRDRGLCAGQAAQAARRPGRKNRLSRAASRQERPRHDDHLERQRARCAGRSGHPLLAKVRRPGTPAASQHAGAGRLWHPGRRQPPRLAPPRSSPQTRHVDGRRGNKFATEWPPRS